MNSGFSFQKEPTAVYEYLQSKNAEIHFDYDEIAYDAHKKTFTIAKMIDLDLLKDMQNSLSQAFKDGTPFEEWKQSVKPMLAKKGWLGRIKVKDPKSGEEKEIYVGNRRLKTIYDTNMRTAYAKARYESQMKSSGEYFRYTAVLDSKTRPTHRKLHGTTLPKNDKFWDTNYPPNGWNCRCKVQVLTEAEVRARGITPLADGSFLPNVAQDDFAYNPGKMDHLDEIFNEKKKEALGAVTAETARQNLKERLAGFKHERNLYVWQKGLDGMVDAVIGGIIIKDKVFQVAQVGELGPGVKASLKQLGVEPKADSIAVYQNTISHITRDSKPKSKEPNAAEIKAIVGVFDRAKHVFYDKQKGNLLYFYKSLQNDQMVNYAAVDLDFVLKKFKTDNFIATISKMPFINFRNILRDKKRYEKVR